MFEAQNKAWGRDSYFTQLKSSQQPQNKYLSQKRNPAMAWVSGPLHTVPFSLCLRRLSALLFLATASHSGLSHPGVDYIGALHLEETLLFQDCKPSFPVCSHSRRHGVHRHYPKRKLKQNGTPCYLQTGFACLMGWLEHTLTYKGRDCWGESVGDMSL